MLNKGWKLLLSMMLMFGSFTNIVQAEGEEEPTPTEQSEEVVEEEVVNEPVYQAGSLDVSNNDYEIKVSYGEDAKIPEGSYLSVTEIQQNTYEYDSYVESTATTILPEGNTLPYARFFDITIFDGEGNKVEPAGKVSVEIDLKDDVLSTEDVTFQAVHFEEGNDNVEVVNIDTSEVVSFEAESFSVYGVVYYYTVDFFYNGSEYHMNGGSEMMLSELFGKLGITRSVEEITDLEFTNYDLVNFTKEGSDYRITSLSPFKTSESLIITFSDGEQILINVEDELGSGTFNTDVYWQLSDDGILTIRPLNAVTPEEEGTRGVITTSRTTPGAWPWNAANLKNKIVEVRFAKSANGARVTVGNGVNTGSMFDGCGNLKKVDLTHFDGSNSNSFAYMFRDCKKLEEITFGEFTPTKATSLAGMFQNCSSLTKLDLSSFKNGGYLWEFKDFCNGCTNLKEFILNNPEFITRVPSSATNASSYPRTGATGAQVMRFFQGCNNLERVDMSNITVGGRLDPNQEFGSGYTSEKVYGLLEGKDNLVEVKMDNIKLPGMKNLSNMIMNCPKLHTVSITGVCDFVDAVNMAHMFYGSMTTASAEPVTDPNRIDISGFGILPNIESMSGLVGECTQLNDFVIDNLDNSAIKTRIEWDHAYGPNDYEWAKNLLISDTSTPNLRRISAKNSKVWMSANNKGNAKSSMYYHAASESDLIYFTKHQVDAQTDDGRQFKIVDLRDYVDLITDRQETGARGADYHDESTTNINTKDGHINENGAGFLPSGLYNIDRNSKWEDETIEPTETFHRITGMGTGGTPTVEIVNNPNNILVKDGNKINTIEQPKSVWGTDEDDEYTIGDGKDVLVRITYPGVAEDIYGETHDVVVEVKKITFKNTGLVPTVDSGYVRRLHDSNNVAIDDYYRTVLEAKDDQLVFRNYVRSTLYENEVQTINQDGQVLSNGSGTYIDFDITIPDAMDGQSLLFYIDDLDVPHAQNWVRDPDDACYDDLPWENVVYGSGSEGMILNQGNDIDTLTFAKHTGLEVLNRNEVVGTGSDPMTSWSEFYVRAAATGASYTWTSGIACDTVLLKNTAPPTEPKPVNVIVDALKHVNGANPESPYADAYFEFDLKPADNAGTNYGGHTDIVSLPNKADVSETKFNKDEIIPFDLLTLPVPEDDTPEKYVFEISEKEGSTGDDIIDYDDETKFFVQIVVYRPSNDLEMYQGTRAEIVLGTKIGDSPIYWDTEYVITVYSNDAQPAPDVYVDPHTGNEYIIRETTMDSGDILYIEDEYGYHEFSYEDGIGNDLTVGDEGFNPSKDDPTAPMKRLMEAEYTKRKTANATADIEYCRDTDGVYYDSTGANELTPGYDGFNPDDMDPVVYDASGNPEKISVGKFVQIYEDAKGTRFYCMDGKYYKVGTDEEFELTQHAKVNKTVVYGSGVYDVFEDHDGVEYFKDDEGNYRDPLHPDRELIIASTGDIDPEMTKYDSAVTVPTLVNGKQLRQDVHGQKYYVDIEEGETVYKDENGSSLTVEDGTFNPDDEYDIYVVENRVVDGETVYDHVNGQEYIKKGNDYYDANDPTKKLEIKVKGEVDPLPTDEHVQVNEIVEMVLRETNTGNNNPIYVESHGIQYYYDSASGMYYTRYGTIINPSSDFSPTADDPMVTVTREIWVDNQGRRFYKSERKYFDENDHEIQLGDDILDTSEIVTAGTFNNLTKVSDIKITKETVDGKAHEFKIHVKFDNKFKPRFVVYENPGKFAEFTPVEGTDDTWEFTLIDGQSLTIKDVPFHTTYTVSEPSSSLEGWELVSIDDDTSLKEVSKRITKQITDDDYNQDYEHVFKNRYTELILSKVVEQGDKNKKFTFKPTITVTGLEEGETVTYGTMDENDNHAYYESGPAGTDGTVTITMNDILLKDKEDIVLVMPLGAKAEVVETLDGYVVTITGDFTSKDQPNGKATIDAVADKNTLTYSNKGEGPTVNNINTVDVIGVVQSSTFSVTKGTAAIKSKKLLDPRTGEPTDATTIDALDEEGNVIGSYTYDSDSDYITFTPDSTFVGKPRAARLRVTDEAGLTADGLYQPNVKDNRGGPTATDAKSKDVKDKSQKGTITVKPGTSPIRSVQLDDPRTGQPTTATEVDALDASGNVVGKYSFDPSAGKENPDGSISYEITFVPNPGYVGTPRPVKLRVTDENGLYAHGTYQPVVTGGVTPVPPTPTPGPGWWVPYTGDPSNTLLWFGLMMASLFAFLILGYKYRSLTK